MTKNEAMMQYFAKNVTFAKAVLETIRTLQEATVTLLQTEVKILQYKSVQPNSPSIGVKHLPSTDTITQQPDFNTFTISS
jgi:hypothetical protein